MAFCWGVNITRWRRCDVWAVRARQLRRRHMTTIWAAGVLMAVPLSIPLLNLLIPILGAATFTHLFHVLPHPKD